MRAAVLEIPSKNFARSSFRLSTKNAWAKWVRNAYRTNALLGLMEDFGLTEGQARGVIYAQASQPTIDQILDHPRGGFWLGLEILCIRLGTTLEDKIAERAEEARHVQAQAKARERHFEALGARLPELHLVLGRSSDEDLGGSTPPEGLSDPKGSVGVQKHGRRP